MEKNKSALCGDNSKILPILDLSEFNVIDLDAYGVPVEQIESVLNNPTLKKGSTIFITCIISTMGPVPYALGKYIGFSEQTMGKAKHLFNIRIKELMATMLYKLGVKKDL